MNKTSTANAPCATPGADSLLNTLNRPVTTLASFHKPVQQTHAMMSGFLRLVQACINFQVLPLQHRRRIRPSSPHHSCGLLQCGLTPSRTVPAEMIDAWIRDTDHGLLHGLSVAFFATLFNDRGRFRCNEGNEILVTSCLLHDFLRCSDIHESHDELLKNWYPDLSPITYVHSSPPSDHIYHPLVIGDRIELLRYNDHADWVNEKVIAPYLKDATVRDIVTAYYRFIRPALEKVFQGRDDAWLRHSVESEKVLSTASLVGDGLTGSINDSPAGMFPSRYWAPYPECWCVEIGSSPFGYNITRDLNTYHPFPILSLSRYYEMGGRPLRPVRDHLAACAQIPLREWITLLHDDDLSNPANDQILTKCGGFVQLSLVNGLLTISDYLRTFMQAVRFRG